MARFISATTSNVSGRQRKMGASTGDPEDALDPHREIRYEGKVGRRMRAARILYEGSLLVDADCCHMSVYSSPRVWMAAVDVQSKKLQHSGRAHLDQL
jgi:hypothetical protein